MKGSTLLPLLALTALPLYAQEEAQPPATAGEPQVQDHAAHGAVGETTDREAHWTKDFAEADKDGDGFLSAVEARDALPSHVLVIDTDNDGQLSKLEVQNAVPGLNFEDGGEDSVDSRIGEEEYDAIVQALEEGGDEQDV